MRTLPNTHAVAVLAILTLAGCGQQVEAPFPPAPEAAVPPIEAETQAQPASPSALRTSDAAIEEARKRMEDGRVDEAAARLAQLQLQGATFDRQQALNYRRALDEAWDRAIEAIERGDPRGEAALKLLRAAGPR